LLSHDAKIECISRSRISRSGTGHERRDDGDGPPQFVRGRVPERQPLRTSPWPELTSASLGLLSSARHLLGERIRSLLAA
jgi:hypothetical protein